MGQSYRIRTGLGLNKTINIQLDQQFEFLEILSLKLQQEDIYTKSCAEYGVVVGRVTANNGFGIPNARVSVFIPIDSIDESNPIISSIYPYKSPNDKNEDGYRYNLLPYEPSYSVHAATGTLPTRLDVLTGDTAVEIYDKYYKYTCKTNESGDYMIMGVPQGNHSLVMDVDLSDIGEFSLTPQDLIRMGLASEAQVAGNRFRTSTDLNSLPQIINIVKDVEVSPLWGDPQLCDIAINRVDFDLRDDANVDIQPTATFMGSIFSSPDKMRIRKSGKPKDNLGNLCDLISGPGQILAIRQTIEQDENGNPVLEQYQLEQSGNIIDGNGVWLTELPMNLDYYITNEFGEKVLSNDPTVGIPTKGKYRFKVKWQQPPTLSEQTRRPYYLLPNVKEYGWINSDNDPLAGTLDNQNKLESSYYFGLDWSGYTNGFTTTTEYYNRLNEIINCEDTFYEFDFNRVYTTSQLIDEYKNARGRGRFIGIKEIDDDSCNSTINKFPVNEGFRNFDLLFFLFSFILQIIQLIGVPLIVVARIILFFYAFVTWVLCGLCRLEIPIINVRPFGFICNNRFFTIDCEKGLTTDMSLTMLTYPDCETCDCKSVVSEPRLPQNVQEPTVFATGGLTYFSSPVEYQNSFTTLFNTLLPSTTDVEFYTKISSEAIGGLSDFNELSNPQAYKLPISNLVTLPNTQRRSASSKDLPLGERVNLFNQRENFFTGSNKIKVSFATESNIGKYHYDNTITILGTPGVTYNSGDLLSFVNPNNSNDVNYSYSADTTEGVINGISGTSYTTSGPTTVNVSYAATQTSSSSPVIYSLPSGSTITNYRFAADIEYYQVLTAITVSQATNIWNTGNTETFPNILNSPTTIDIWGQPIIGTPTQETKSLTATTINPLEYYENYGDQVILILQRGVDPYSPKYKNKYGIGKILGFNSEDDYIIECETRINIPIQPISSASGISVQPFLIQDNIFYQSYFFRPGITGSSTPGLQYSAFTSDSVGYYSSLDKSNAPAFVDTSFFSKEITSLSSNAFYSTTISSSKYDLSEDVSGVAIMNMTAYNTEPCSTYTYVAYGPGDLTYVDCQGVSQTINFPSTLTYSGNICVANNTQPLLNTISGQVILSISPCSKTFAGNWPSSVVPSRYYWSKAFGPTFTMQITNPVKNILRTDRLPTSDILDGGSWDNNPSILQQNLQFAIYQINEQGQSSTINYGPGASQVSVDLGGLPYEGKVLESFSCEGMVPLNCYEGFGSNFRVNTSCSDSYVKNGCYVILKDPWKLFRVFDDIKTWSEWGYRFRFMYGLCRGVLSQTFTNNWINGSLFMFPIQTDVYYDTQNKPQDPIIPSELVYFDKKTFNFYFRSSPYSISESKFIGRTPSNPDWATNDKNLMFPTTLINLGFKDRFYSEITFDPSTNAYIIPSLNPTSYGDTSDLVNLFVVSRLVDSSFLKELLSFTNDSIGILFSRPNGGVLSALNPKNRVDADFVQLCSINSEIGNINFSPEYYETTQTNSPTNVLGTAGDPVMAVWFSSTTQDLQTKDYLTPGRINFRSFNNTNNYPYSFGIKSQTVPLYRWELKGGNTIFGSQLNNWATTENDIVQQKYQSLDRTYLGNPNYFRTTNSDITDLYARGYIFSVESNGNYTANPNTNATGNKLIVGAPFHFYFGVVKGETALDLFKRKYSVDE